MSHSNGNSVDSYNFINIYKKRVTTENFNLISKSKQKVALAQKATSHHNTDNYTTQDFASLDTNSRSNPNNNISKSNNNNQVHQAVSSSSSTSSIFSELSLSHSSSANSNGKVLTQKKQSASSQSKKPSERSREKLEMYENENEETMSGIESSSSSASSSSSGASSSTSLTKSAPHNSKSVPLLETKSTSPSYVVAKSREEKLVEPAPPRKNLKQLSLMSRVDNVNGGEMRYTPAALEQLLNAGLNHLEVLNLSALQLEELDKVRCIGVAQQETVALAHLIKNQKTNETLLDQVKKSLLHYLALF